MDTENDKLEVLSDRIRKAGDKPRPVAETLYAGRNIGVNFIGVVIGSGVLGGLLDYGLGTVPWCSLAMIFGGFAVGMLITWRAMQRSDNGQ